MNTLITHNASLVRSKEERRQIDSTFRGMAHFGGTGPAGHTCRECQHWHPRGKVWDTESRVLLPASCDRFKRLMGVAKSPRFPHSAPACSHFFPGKPRPARKPEPRP